MAKTRCEICNTNFKNEESLAQHNAAKHQQENNKKPINLKKIRKWIIALIILGMIISGIYFTITRIDTLPPTDIQGHVEKNPPSHILKQPMPLAIQKHMLEHADGIEGGRPGIIINYNCKDYECEAGMIEELEAFAVNYSYVYVAPFRGMKAKIALTKLNQIQVLEEYDAKKIEEFVR